MADNKKKLLFFGLSYFIRRLVESVTQTRPCIAVDTDVLLLDEWGKRENITLHIGDANSIVLWKKLPLAEVSHIIFSLNDPDVAEELCRIARETFRLDIPIIAVAHKKLPPKYLSRYNVLTIDPVAVGIGSVMALIDKNYAVPANAGLGKGELVEVSVLRRSHLVDRKLRHLESTHWKVAAIYRDDELILPDGNSELRIGDKTLLVGEPAMLSNIVNIMMQGVPQFPQQYGRRINVVINKTILLPMEEANYFRAQIQAKDFACLGTEESIALAQKNDVIVSMSPQFEVIPQIRHMGAFKEAGLVVVHAPRRFSMFNRRLKYYMKKAKVPLLLAKGVFPYENIIVSLNSSTPGQVLQIAIEISRLSGLPLIAIYVAPPKSLRNAQMESDLADRQRIVRDYENIDHIKINYKVMEGNPVKKMVESQKDYPKTLVIIGNDVKQKISLFEPHVPYLLAERLDSSLLVVPVTESY